MDHQTTPASALDDASLLDAVVANAADARVVDARALELAAEVARRSEWSLGADGLSSRYGQRRPEHLLEQLTLVSAREARERIRIGTALAPRYGLGDVPLPARFPTVSAAVASGAIGRDAAAAIIRNLSDAALRCAPDDLITAEHMLVERAVSEPADVVADHARLARDYLDPDGAEPRDEVLRQRRRFTIGRERDGMTPFAGLADPLSAATLRGAVDAQRPSAPRFSSDDLDAPPDDRTRPQVDFDTLLNLITAGAAADGVRPGPRATVTVVVPKQTLDDRVGLGRLDGIDTPVAFTSIDTLICDGGMEFLFLSEHGTPLFLGRTQRLFSRAQRRAIAARDGDGCVWPLCTARASACDAHHIVHWERGGLTDIDNGVLLCPAHHHHIHTTGTRLRMRDGRPELQTIRAWVPLRGRYATPMRT